MPFDHAEAFVFAKGIRWSDSINTGVQYLRVDEGGTERAEALRYASHNDWEMVAVEGDSLFFKRPKP